VDAQVLAASLSGVDTAELARLFYAELFRAGGQRVVEMFPPGMDRQRDRLLAALVRVLTSLDDEPALAQLARGLGRNHRFYGPEPADWDLVGGALLYALAAHKGADWTEDLAAQWEQAYTALAKLMTAAFTEDDGLPRAWDATVTDVSRRTPDIAVLAVRLAAPMAWTAGQSVLAEWLGAPGGDRQAGLPRFRRPLTPANPPGDGRTMIFHVRAVDGGIFSTGITARAAPGDVMRLSAPAGVLTLAATPRPVLFLAGSTGLAPMAAMLEELAAREHPPAARLYFGAQSPDGLYDLDALAAKARARPWLEVTPAVSGRAPASWEGARGTVIDVAARDGDWSGWECYVCGSPAMVQVTTGRLIGLGVPGGQVHAEQWGD
jgi:NAD(P)H-flavin reductase/hemoglobin-like flavoprotein